MKKIINVILIFIFCSLFKVSAQNCKPDFSKSDKISKQQIVRWEQTLYETSFGSSMINSSEVNITATVGRYGNVNAINVEIRKQEESAQNAAFESQYQAIKGNEFYFGIKDGEALKFVATEVNNFTKMDNLLGKLVTTIVLSCVVDEGDLVNMKNSLTLNLIDGVRIMLANNVRIEKAVKENKAQKMRGKFIYMLL